MKKCVQCGRRLMDWKAKAVRAAALAALAAALLCGGPLPRFASAESAGAVCRNPAGCVTESTVFVKTALRRCMIAQPETNSLADGGPVYVFFPGTGEMDDINHVNTFVKRYHLYDNAEGNLITVSTKNHRSFGNPKDWEEIAEDVADYLEERYNRKPFEIRIDTISFGGRGGVYLAGILISRGIPVGSLNLGDSCGEMGAYSIRAEELADIAKAGTVVNIAASDRSSKWSVGTRRMIEELAGVENVNGYVKHASHTEALALAISEDGIHSR